uniref:Uncharacterized protein n=1 Tax=Ditylenchus dipsaci TaxID=166011 RepID=A0A915DRX7_9BILA
MATSFLAICVQFITPAGIKNYPLDVISFPGHHTGSAISEKTLGKLGDVGNPNVHRFVRSGKDQEMSALRKRIFAFLNPSLNPIWQWRGLSH